MGIKKEEYNKLQERLNKLEKFYFNIKEMNGVLTGHTYSYNYLRDTALNMCKAIKHSKHLNPDIYEHYKEEIAEKYKKAIEHADQIAWHNSILQDCCLGGYDWLFDLED